MSPSTQSTPLDKIRRGGSDVEMSPSTQSGSQPDESGKHHAKLALEHVTKAVSPQLQQHQYFRLDYLWGKASTKIAVAPPSQPVQKDVGKQMQLNQLAETVTDVSCVPAPAKKAGRPPGKVKTRKELPGCVKKRSELTAKSKSTVLAVLREKQSSPGFSKHQARKNVASQFGVSESLVRRLEKVEVADKLGRWLAQREVGKKSLRIPGSTLPLSKLVSKSQGRRLPGQRGYLGTTDHLRSIWLQTRVWARNTEAAGHELSPSDVLRDFRLRLASAVVQREKLATLTPLQQKELGAWKKKQETLDKNVKQRDKYKQVLVNRCGLIARAAQRATVLSPVETHRRVCLAWRLWDQTLWMAGQADPNPDLAVHDACSFAVNHQLTALTMSDQVPVWLLPSPEKLLTDRGRLLLGIH
jgi:hypothetical protein